MDGHLVCVVWTFPLTKRTGKHPDNSAFGACENRYPKKGAEQLALLKLKKRSSMEKYK